VQRLSYYADGNQLRSGKRLSGGNGSLAGTAQESNHPATTRALGQGHHVCILRLFPAAKKAPSLIRGPLKEKNQRPKAEKVKIFSLEGGCQRSLFTLLTAQILNLGASGNDFPERYAYILQILCKKLPNSSVLAFVMQYQWHR
jgi:hypothetical protein